MAQTEIQTNTQSETLETWKSLYQKAWEIAFAETMFLMADQYNLQLYLMVDGEKLPSPIVKFWRESLQELSPVQMREGLSRYMDSERRSFKPVPGDLKSNIPEATDKPRRVKDPNCSLCSGSGFKAVLIDSRIHIGQKARAVTDCDCVAIEYEGQRYRPEVRQLPAPKPVQPQIANDIEDKVSQAVAKGVVKTMPARRELSDEDLAKRKAEMLADLEKAKKA